eukprot:7057512-Pyramimonas_sp.AAC.1
MDWVWVNHSRGARRPSPSSYLPCLESFLESSHRQKLGLVGREGRCGRVLSQRARSCISQDGAGNGGRCY